MITRTTAPSEKKTGDTSETIEREEEKYVARITSLFLTRIFDCLPAKLLRTFSAMWRTTSLVIASFILCQFDVFVMRLFMNESTKVSKCEAHMWNYVSNNTPEYLSHATDIPFKYQRAKVKSTPIVNRTQVIINCLLLNDTLLSNLIKWTVIDYSLLQNLKKAFIGIYDARIGVEGLQRDSIAIIW